MSIQKQKFTNSNNNNNNNIIILFCWNEVFNFCQATYVDWCGLSMRLYTVFRKKTPTYFSDVFGVYWSILILFVPTETGMNTLQFIYLIPRRRHKSVTSHVKKVYFIEILLNIKYRPIEFWRHNLDQNLWNVNDFLLEDWYFSQNCFTKKYQH